ncbi:probable tocopherol O-methyltransferase, chloroplastic [Tanacetum coccineum]
MHHYKSIKFNCRYGVPDGCDLVHAGALPVAYGTSHVALVHRVNPGQRIHTTQNFNRMFEEWAHPKKCLHDPEGLVKKPMSKVYVGCGIGVCAMHLSRKYGAECSVITISHVPAERAHALATAQGLSNKSDDDECETVNVIKTVDVPLKDNLADAIDDKIRLEFQKFDKGIRQCEGTMPEFHDGERQSIRVDHLIVSVVGNFAVSAFSKACKKVWHAIDNFTVVALWPASVWSS